MTDHSERLHAFVDGELDDAEAAEFERHLAACRTCAAELPSLLTLLAALDGAAELAAARRPTPARLTVIAGGAAEPSRPDAGAPLAPGPAPTARRPGRPRRAWPMAALGIALAAAAALILVLRSSSAPPAGPSPGGAVALALGPTRPIEARLSLPGAGDYRPVNVQRGAAIDASDHLLQLERDLEQAKNWHGAAVVAVLTGDRTHAARAFARAPASPDVDSDHAAFELQDGTPAALERALELVDRALAAAPNHPAAHWNRALVLAAMNLPLAAAKELDAVRALGERGWADEARIRADALRAQATRRRTHWKQASDAGLKMIEDGTPAALELADVSGTMTLMLYDAVREAPSRERALTLLPLARALDGVYRSTRLTAYVERIAASDFRVRKPLADRYRELMLGRAASGSTDVFLQQLVRAGTVVDDIRMGVLVFAGRLPAQLDDYRRLAAATADPWFAIIAEQATADADIARGDTAAGERRLRDAIALGRREHLSYRAIRVENDLIQLLKSALELSQAATESQVVYREAIAAGEWVLEMGVLADLASIHQNRYAYGLARAYLTELVERTEAGLATGDDTQASVDCLRRMYAYGSLAHISLLQAEPDPARARAELSHVPTCAQASTTRVGVATLLRNALVHAELYRGDHRAEDAQVARDGLAAVRDVQDAVLPGKEAFLSYVEGELLTGDDPGAARAVLREAIARAGQDLHDFNVKARAYSYSLLAIEAARASAFGDMIDVMAEALRLTPPKRCALVVALDGERRAVAYVDANRQTGGQYLITKPGPVEVAGIVPSSIVERLRACEHVAVLARPPVLGMGRLLPPEVAWSYVLTDGAPASSTGSTLAHHRLVVANPDTPPALDLPALGPYPEELNGHEVTVLRGGDATPSRTLLAMQDASVIEFHTHGVMADDLFEASHLALSPEVDQRYRLTAGDVAGTRLVGSPLVILGACHAAASSRSLEGGMGLAEAFLHAGARAVIASPDAVQDLGAHAFFAAVRDRVLHGSAPAAALRDERMRHLAASPDDTWVSGVVVFQ